MMTADTPNLAFTPVTIGPLTLRNRFVKTATYEGMTPGGRISDDVIAHHVQMARGGVALTTVAYGAVHPDGRTFSEQLLVDDGCVPGLSQLTSAVHEAGAAVSLQLSHCGGFSKNRAVTGGRPAGPSPRMNPYGLAYGLPRVRAMNDDDLAKVMDAFVTAARHARAAGFDAVEVHCGHGYLLSQFLSPVFNRRTDRWGGPLENRARLSVEVVRRVVEAVGDTMAVLVKLNLSDGVKRGFTRKESVEVARQLTAAGAHAVVPSGGLVQKSAFYLMRGAVPIRQMARAESSRLQRVALRMFAPFLVKPWPYESTFFFDDAAELLDGLAEQPVPVGLLGGVNSAAAVDKALRRGFAFVVVGRALIADPGLIARIAAGEDVTSRCDHCNECVAEMDVGGVRCTLDDRA